MSCDRIQSRLSAYLDGELPARQRVSVEEHLCECAECTAQLDTLEELSNDVRTLPPAGELSPGWEASLAARVAMIDEEEIAAERSPRPRLLPQVLGLAAMLLLGVAVGLVTGRMHQEPDLTLAALDRPGAEPTRTGAGDAGEWAASETELQNARDFALAGKGVEDLAEFAEHVYLAADDVKVLDIVPGETDAEKLDWLRSSWEFLDLRDRSRRVLESLEANERIVERGGRPVLVGVDDQQLERLGYLARSVERVGELLATGDERELATISLAYGPTLVENSSWAAFALRPLAEDARRTLPLPADHDGLPAIAAQMRYHALERSRNMMRNCLMQLEDELGEPHEYVRRCRDYWGRVAELAPGSSSVPLVQLLQSYPEVSLGEVNLILIDVSGGNSDGRECRSVRFQIHLREPIELPHLEGLDVHEIESRIRQYTTGQDAQPHDKK